MLHPQYKLDYFEKAGWEQKWIDTAKSMLRDEFETYYMPLVADSARKSSDSRPPKEGMNLDVSRLFDELDSFGTSSDSDVLDSWLRSPTDPRADPIRYWTLQLDPKDQPATATGALAHMALDFLSAPGTLKFSLIISIC